MLALRGVNCLMHLDSPLPPTTSAEVYVRGRRRVQQPFPKQKHPRCCYHPLPPGRRMGRKNGMSSTLQGSVALVLLLASLRGRRELPTCHHSSWWVGLKGERSRDYVLLCLWPQIALIKAFRLSGPWLSDS